MPKASADLKVVEFNQEVKHGPHRFIKGTVVQFDDPEPGPYFVKCGWADPSDWEPMVVYEAGSVEIDPDTIHQASGLKVADLDLKSEG